MNAARRAWLRWRLPGDTFERHAIVARLTTGAERVLDVGGVRGELDGFLASPIETANVDGAADHLLTGGALPFADGSYDTVVSLDTLEHVPAGDRRRFFAECLRVASCRVVLCAPFGTDEHERLERTLDARHRERYGGPNPWLAEHLENGLPRCDLLDELVADAQDAGFRARVGFHGDIRTTAAVFEAAMDFKNRPTPASAAHYAWRRLIARDELALADRPHPFTNRFFLSADC